MSQALDNQIYSYIPLLGVEEKESLLGVIKSFLSLKGKVEAEVEEPSHHYDEATIAMLHERRDAQLTGKSKSYSVEESAELIRSGKR